MTARVLLVIDLLNDFLNRWDETRRATLIHHTNALIACFRKSGSPVIWVRQEFEPDLSDAFLEMKRKNISITIKGTAGAQICPELDRHYDDLVIVKKRYSAFYQTSLETILEDMGLPELTLCGVNTHACVRMTALDAYQRDMEVIIATDCVGTNDPPHGDISLSYLEAKTVQLRSNQSIMATLEAD